MVASPSASAFFRSAWMARRTLSRLPATSSWRSASGRLAARLRCCHWCSSPEARMARMSGRCVPDAAAVGATGPATIRSATDIAAGGWWAVFTYAAPDLRNRFSRFLRKRRLEPVRRGVNSPARTLKPGDARGVHMRRVTIRDVAAEAGVSIGTASKALNGQGKLRTETRERVAEVAQRLGFAPNTLAQALLAGRSFTVGLITPDSFGRFSIPVMLGAEDALGNGQVSVFMCDTRDDPEREQRYVEMLAARRVDGLIVPGRRTEPRRAVTAGPGIPVVYAMTQPLGQDGPAVLPDDEGGGRAAAGHLLEAGRQRIGHITGPERFLAARKRAEGFGAAVAGAGLRPCGGLRFGEWSERWGREAARQLLDELPDTDAIFCGSDQIARGVADTLR